MAMCFGANGHTVSLLAVTVVLVLKCSTGGEGTFTLSLELQGGDCSDQLTLICRHSDTGSAPLWIHNGTAEGGVVLRTAFRSAVYTVLARTEHTATITGIDNVRALDGHVIQCAYDDLDGLIKSNATKYFFIPPDYQPKLSLVSFKVDVSEHFCTFTYSFQESCNLYPRCTPYFSVEHTVSPQSVVSNTSSGCSVEYTILNLMRCRSYQSTATALLDNQRGNTVVMGSTVTLSPGQFTITSVTIEAGCALINVTFVQYEPDCPGYPTERYTVDIDGVKVADMTADEFQSRITTRTNGSVTLSLPLTQRLPEKAMTVNMTKFNTVLTNMSDDMGNIVTEMVTWETSAVYVTFNPQVPTVPPNPMVSQEVFTGVVCCLIALYIVSMTIFGGITAVLCWKIHTLKQKGSHCSTCRCIGKSSHLPPNPGEPASSGAHTPTGDSTPSGNVTCSGDPTPSGDLISVQLQPNPSYCLLEMSHQQLMNSQLDEAKYVNL